MEHVKVIGVPHAEEIHSQAQTRGCWDLRCEDLDGTKGVNSNTVDGNDPHVQNHTGQEDEQSQSIK